MIQGIGPAISAIRAFAKKLGSFANNVANVNTQGFKKGRLSFQAVCPQNMSTPSGPSQIGRGTTLEEISEDFSQGSFEPTSSSTDMAVAGYGFFVVHSSEGETYYTRDGQFYFDKNARLMNTSGDLVQGWALDPITGEVQGAIQDITLPSFTSPPAETTILKNIVNLNVDAEDKSVGLHGLAGAWDGGNPDGEYIADNAYAYRTTTKVYDGVGSAHDITLYFDKSGSGNVWEYIVTGNPAEDRRPGATGDNLGLLARGTLAFNSSGAFSAMSMDTNDGTGNWTSQDVATDMTDGHFTFHPDFLGTTNATVTSVQLDFGSFYNGISWVNDPSSTTQYASPSNTIYSFADGYGTSNLESVTVDKDGVISGHYSDSQVLGLFQVAVAQFHNPQGLKKVGNNLYAKTEESGDAMTGQPGTNGLGRIVSNTLEQSNIDIGEEFVNIIFIKRSFQVNLNMIFTENKMIGDVLNIIS